MLYLVRNRLKEKVRKRETEIIKSAHKHGEKEDFGKEKTTIKVGKIAAVITFIIFVPLILYFISTLIIKYIGDIEYIKSSMEACRLLAKIISFPALLPTIVFWLIWLNSYVHAKEDNDDFEEKVYGKK